jgi:CRISPR/Cas system-associated exonuclease Cas4 (RecB family)
MKIYDKELKIREIVFDQFNNCSIIDVISDVSQIMKQSNFLKSSFPRKCKYFEV